MLEKERIKIDEIDQVIMKLLDERMQIAKNIKKIKMANNIEVLDSNREQQIFAKIEQMQLNNTQQVHDIYEKIMEVSKQVQNQQLVDNENETV